MLPLLLLQMAALSALLLQPSVSGPPPPPKPLPPYWPCVYVAGMPSGMLTTLAAEARNLSAGDFSQILNYGRPLPRPPTKGQVLIRVNASSVNPVDWKIAETGANMGLSFPHILGFDVAGEVVACPGCARLKPGDLVWADLGKRWALRGGELGAYAQCALADESQGAAATQLDFWRRWRAATGWDDILAGAAGGLAARAAPTTGTTTDATAGVRDVAAGKSRCFRSPRVEASARLCMVPSAWAS